MLHPQMLASIRAEWTNLNLVLGVLEWSFETFVGGSCNVGSANATAFSSSYPSGRLIA